MRKQPLLDSDQGNSSLSENEKQPFIFAPDLSNVTAIQEKTIKQASSNLPSAVFRSRTNRNPHGITTTASTY